MTHLDSDRAYRGALTPAEGETCFTVVVEESDLRITARRDLSCEIVHYLTSLRGELKNYILLRPEFATSLVPLSEDEAAPDLARKMLEAARCCQVGPMAAVAGAVAQAVADRFAPESPDILVENGGDLYLHSTRERLVALLAKPVQGARLALRLSPEDFPTALCGSSATIGHSLSFGRADLVTVKARSGALADAAATTLGNLARSGAHLPLVLERAQELARFGVTGVFAQVDDTIGVWGDMELAVLE
ncbi:UPF0280 family protein [Fundidesulfovibrio terrae]|uniref:UPF0280 family protein n=1 Tax=Fundidesulfovibrio terrae TaxID=2922866 RepID=UPI001FAEF0A1|nr:UPF0280 family protein [Fundidesulfovibrio terrae]